MDPEILEAIKVIMAAPSATKEAVVALLSPPQPQMVDDLGGEESSNSPLDLVLPQTSSAEKRAKLDRGGAKQVVHWRLQLSSMYFVYRPYVFAYVTQLKSTYLLTKVELYGCTFKGG